jgi:hypothetical protein
MSNNSDDVDNLKLSPLRIQMSFLPVALQKMREREAWEKEARSGIS